MADTREKPEREDDTREDARAVEDPRKPYEPPRLLKKRSVARATLHSTTSGGRGAPGVTMMG